MNVWRLLPHVRMILITWNPYAFPLSQQVLLVHRPDLNMIYDILFQKNVFPAVKKNKNVDPKKIY